MTAALRSLGDIDTGNAIVADVFRMNVMTPPEVPYRALVPNLVVRWGDVSAIESSRIVSERFDEMRLRNAGKLALGGEGNHWDKSWFVVVGQDIEPGSRADGHHIVDLAPTVCRWLRGQPDDSFKGQPVAGRVT